MRQTVTAIMADVADATSHKRVANNTVRYERSNGDTVWRLHNTDIVTKHADGTFTLNSGGWRTPTTKGRINDYAPCNVYASKGTWTIAKGGPWMPDGVQTPFYDGIRVDAEGNPVAALDAKAEKLMLLRAELDRKHIGTFCDLVDKRHVLPRPDLGDCLYCTMIAAEPTRDKRGSAFSASGPADDTDHLREHIKESYLHGSLLVNAMRWAGYSESGIALYYDMATRDGKRGRAVFKRALRRYLQRKLGVG